MVIDVSKLGNVQSQVALALALALEAFIRFTSERNRLRFCDMARQD
jgi:hypothetical protein